MLKALFWKEWREHRLIFFLSIAIVIITRLLLKLSLLVVTPQTKDAFERLGEVSVVIYVLLSLLFTLFFGAAPFTNEFTKGTHTFLLCQPISRARVYWIKFFFGLVLLSFLIIFANLILLAPWFNYLFSIEFNVYVKVFLFIIFVIYSTTFFTSLLLKNSLVTIVATPFVIVIGLLLIIIPLLPLVFLWELMKLSEIQAYVSLGLILSLLLILLGLLCWQRAISKSKNPVKILSFVLASTIFPFLVTYTITNSIADRELRNATISAKKAGVPLTIKEIIPPPIPDTENSAFVYEEIFSIYENLNKRYPEVYKNMPSGKKIDIKELSSDQRKRLIEFFDDPDFGRMSNLLKKAVDMPSCRFNIRYEDGYDSRLPHLDKMRKIARILSAKTYFLTEENEYEKAIEFARIGLRFDTGLQEEPIYISQLVRIRCDDIAMDGLMEIISNIPSGAVPVDVYRRLIAEIELKNGNISIRKALEGEAAFYKDDIFKRILRRQLRPAEIGIISSHNLFNIREQFLLRIYFSYLGKPWVKRDATFYLRYMSKIIPLCDSPYYQIKDVLKELGKHTSIDLWRYPISMMVLPAGNIQMQQAENTAGLDGLKIALALKIHKAEKGEYPDSLEPLVPNYLTDLPKDPFAGKDYLYHEGGNGFVVYSVGRNEKDDGGISEDRKSYPKRDDIVWHSSK